MSTPIHDLETQARHAVEHRTTITREVHVRSVAPADGAEDTREITGVGVPYGEVIEHLFGRETFDPGSIEDGDSARLLWQHRDPIGLVTKGEDAEGGYEFTARVSRTALGDEALVLCRDGVVTGLSIGFEPLEYRIERNEDDGTETLHWTRVKAREFSLVTFPAYESAHTRSSTPMSTSTPNPNALTRADLDEALKPLRAEVATASDQAREALTRNTDAPQAEAPRWQSMGEFIRSLAKGDDDAREYYQRAFAGDTTDIADPISDVNGTGFLGTFIKFIEERRKFTQLFSTGPLPAEGMAVSYGKYKGDTLKVGKQPKQGANLPGPGGLAFENAMAEIITLGGWTEVAIQVIERAPIEWLNTMWTAFGIRYAREAENNVKVAAAKLVADQIAADANVLTITDTTDWTAWLDLLIDADDVFEDTGFKNSGLTLSTEKFKELAHLEGADGRPLMNVFGTGANVVGEIDTAGLTGKVGTVTVRRLRGLTPNTGFFHDPVALKVLEKSPTRLQDQNIINLTQAFSLYGYQSILTPFPEALVPVTFGAADAG